MTCAGFYTRLRLGKPDFWLKKKRSKFIREETLDECVDEWMVAVKTRQYSIESVDGCWC